MARLSTCKGCGKKLQPEEKHIHSSKTYCEECFKKIERDSTEYKQLIEFICNNYELEKPTGFMLKQIKELRTEYGYSYAAMTYTLWYCKEILNKSLIEKYGVALIKHYYDEAKDYYSQQERLKEQINKLSDVEVKTKVVKCTSMNSNKKSASLIDLGNLLEGGDSN
jgi:predicted RNA-binding Zn-ribbon protein involved in translation (DUF1610 family)